MSQIPGSQLGRRKYPNEEKILFFSRTDLEGAELRRAFARKMRDEGYSQAEIARELEVSRTRVQKLLYTPEQQLREYQLKGIRDKKRRKRDPEYAAKVRKYNRRYAQARLDEARDGGRQYQNSVVRP